MQKFLSLGAECIKIQEMADASQGFSTILVILALLLIDVPAPIPLLVSDVYYFCLQLPWSQLMLVYQLWRPK
jgi:hypothetical protein